MYVLFLKAIIKIHQNFQFKLELFNFFDGPFLALTFYSYDKRYQNQKRKTILRVKLNLKRETNFCRAEFQNVGRQDLFWTISFTKSTC